MEQTMTDLQLKAQKAILDDPRTKEHGIEVLEDDGVITLKGYVPSQDTSKAAESVVRELMSVVGVINELHVELEELDDSLKEEVSVK